MLKKILRVLSVAVISFFALYWIVVNAILASPLGPHLMNLRPEMVQIHYVRAWTFIPGVLEVRGFELSMQDRLVQISLTADTVKGNLNPWTLARQKFLATQVVADGVTMRVRPRMDKGDPMVKDIDQLPPIMGYETPIRDVSANEVDAKDIRFLSLEFKDLTADKPEYRVRLYGAAIVLILGANFLTEIPVIGATLAAIFAGVSAAFVGASVVAITLAVAFQVRANLLK